MSNKSAQNKGLDIAAKAIYNSAKTPIGRGFANVVANVILAPIRRRT